MGSEARSKWYLALEMHIKLLYYHRLSSYSFFSFIAGWYGWCFPECLLCDVSSRMGEGCCFACCCPYALAGLRVKLRAQENIQVGTRKSILVHDWFQYGFSYLRVGVMRTFTPKGKGQVGEAVNSSNFFNLCIFMNLI